MASDRPDREASTTQRAAQFEERLFERIRTNGLRTIGELEREARRASTRVRQARQFIKIELGLLVAGGVFVAAAAIAYAARTAPIEVSFLIAAVVLTLLALGLRAIRTRW